MSIAETDSRAPRAPRLESAGHPSPGPLPTDPQDPPPLPFQLRDPEGLRRELAAAGLREVRVETTTEQLEFATGAAMWDWLVNSNPIVRGVLAGLELADDERAALPQALERMVRKRAGGKGTAVLTSPVNIGVGTK